MIYTFNELKYNQRLFGCIILDYTFKNEELITLEEYYNPIADNEFCICKYTATLNQNVLTIYNLEPTDYKIYENEHIARNTFDTLK